jgi:tRNA (uracil-5-)-methyltransferase
MFPKGQPDSPYRVDQLPVASTAINAMMQPLIEAIKSNAILRKRLFQIDFLSNQKGDCLVSLLYHRKLDEQWQAAATSLQETLNIAIIGRSRGQKLVLAQDYVIDTFDVDGEQLHYQQIENSFTQPNALINSRMLQWARSCVEGTGGDLLELYCGNGNFSIALAKCFPKVLATEISKSSIRSALYNCELNGVENISFVRMSAEEVSAALKGEREFRRLRGIALEDYCFSTVLVDPPRAGLDDKTLGFIQQFDNILYISCNPQSLAENLQALKHDYALQRFAVFDQFPQTDHVESGVFLTRR